MNTKVEDILKGESLQLWTQYITQKELGLKKQLSNTLNKFISNVKTLDATTVSNFVYYLTNKHRLEELKINFRLFESIIYPVLISQIKSNTQTANRRLAQFDQFLLPSNPLFKDLKEQLNYNNTYFEPIDFYQKEIEINKTDTIAIAGFLNRVAKGLNYAVHELPDYGLLWDIDNFENEIQRFQNHLEHYPKKHIWQNKMKHWKFVLETWKNYTNKEDLFNNYKEYLKNNNLDFIE